MEVWKISKVVSTHLWNTPLSQPLPTGDFSRDSFHSWRCRGMARGVFSGCAVICSENCQCSFSKEPRVVQLSWGYLWFLVGCSSQLVVNCWFGARWFGTMLVSGRVLLEETSSNLNGCERLCFSKIRDQQHLF